MNLIKIFFRDEQETSVDVYECWEVRWTSRHGEYSSDTRPEIRAFPDKKGAAEFKRALEDAFKLIKHTSATRVTLSRQET